MSGIVWVMASFGILFGLLGMGVACGVALQVDSLRVEIQRLRTRVVELRADVGNRYR